MEMLLLMVVMFGGLFLMSQFSRRQAKKRADAREERLEQEMVPGAWVQTYSGFFGRFVERDGGVVILETPSGDETYWLEKAVSGVGEPPFEVSEFDTDMTDGETIEEFDFEADTPEISDDTILDVDVVSEDDSGPTDDSESDNK